MAMDNPACVCFVIEWVIYGWIRMLEGYENYMIIWRACYVFTFYHEQCVYDDGWPVFWISGTKFPKGGRL